MFFSSTAVLCSEVIKLVTCMIIVTVEQGGNPFR